MTYTYRKLLDEGWKEGGHGNPRSGDLEGSLSKFFEEIKDKPTTIVVVSANSIDPNAFKYKKGEYVLFYK